MKIEDLIKENKTQIINLWLKKFIDTYPKESASFFLGGTAQFANPVGHTFRINLENIFDEFLSDADEDRMKKYVDAVVRIRAVQGFTPSEALCFVPMFKESIWETCGKQFSQKSQLEEWIDFLGRLEYLNNMAFDIYMSCRELLWKHKAEFMNSRTHKLLERANLLEKAVE
ncbi:RsbRD N-terminal domain-containing protein [Desulfonatronovibrio magnus]|uniref:RsbRD N-terminal domain-containing protein n=1 Tax=Desulfonatronovibrio magnus TaxID=698827 RepID=UPI0005EBF385|nr:RsbRD N-terminal domain-containing protein [Desulfonatronovibrio magnus]RQD61824.1 MAG: hypothetical protein D5R98_06430 [Desulfonatronovibrio sp. MSAO_Bac4]